MSKYIYISEEYYGSEGVRVILIPDLGLDYLSDRFFASASGVQYYTTLFG
jgi:hypothetical protein